MRTLAIFVEERVVWEFPLSDEDGDDADVLQKIKSNAFAWPGDEEPEGWREWRMEIRHY